MSSFLVRSLLFAVFWAQPDRLLAQDDDDELPIVEHVEPTRALQNGKRKTTRRSSPKRVVRESEPGPYPRRWYGLEIRSVASIDAALRRRLDERDMATLDDVLAQTGADYLAIVARGPGEGARMDSLTAGSLLRRFVPLLYVREGKASARSFVANLDLSKATDLRFEPTPGQCPEFRPIGQIVGAGALDYGPKSLCRIDRAERHELELLCLASDGLDQYVSLKVVAWADVNGDGLEDVVLARESCDLYEHGYCNSDVFVATRRSAHASFEVLERWHPLRFGRLPDEKGAEFCGGAVLPTTDSVTCVEDCVIDVEPLRRFRDITRLDLRGSGVRDLAAVAELARLDALFLDSTRVTDLTPLKGLERLRTLTLAGTQVQDLRALSALPNLEYLDLSRTAVTDLTPLLNLPRLRTVLFNGRVPPGFKARVKSESAPPEAPTSNCCEHVDPNVRRLHLAEDERMTVWSLRGIERLERLEELDIAGTMIADLTPLMNLKRLRVLNVSHTRVTDFAPLAGLTSLEELDMRGIHVRSLEALRTLTQLRVLWASGVESLRGLEGATMLEELVLSGSPVTDLTPLADARSLRALHVDGTRVANIETLAALTALERVDLSRTQVRSLAGLAAAKRLRSLSLVGTLVRDLSPLRDHPSLQRLDIGETGVRSLDALGAPAALKLLDLRGLTLQESRGFVLPSSLIEVDVRDARLLPALKSRFVATGARMVRTKEMASGSRERPW